ncbi:ScbR family autoregulator-binding transcription factor [Streptomyces sp. NPDC029041]|uniref:ScbR family autoregulator-binding transcription factor n=1 Tax=Streptomyces sp. NPDC029041 TaxID=3155727 RepID=UPI00340AA6CF
MAEQERAIRTRMTILLAAAKVFEERGYLAATISEILSEAKVTKGALYFHFPSKEDLAQAVLTAQHQEFGIPDHPSKLQEVVDILLRYTYLLQIDPMVRAGARLSMSQVADGLDRGEAFNPWVERFQERLEKAQAQGELLPHIVPAETANVIVGAYSGVQTMSQVINSHQDLPARVTTMLRHLLPSIAVPSVLASVDLSEDRGRKVYEAGKKAYEETQAHAPAH